MRMLVLGVSVAALIPALSWGNKHEQMTLEEKSKRSDLVIIASVVATTKSQCFRDSRCAQLKVASKLKGQENGNVVVVFDGLIAEENPPCCKVGSTYLFFLKRIDKDKYASVNGMFGIYPMPNDRQGD